MDEFDRQPCVLSRPYDIAERLIAAQRCLHESDDGQEPTFRGGNCPLFIQAPMVRCSRPPFRRLCRLWGTDISYTHMILVDPFVASSDARDAEFAVYSSERDLVVQLAGTSATRFGEAAQLLCGFCDAVDINCGCPQSWAVRSGIGSAMMTKPELISDVVRTIRRVTPVAIPCAVKMRTFEGNAGKTVDLARQAEAAGAAWITVHGRTPADTPSAPVRVSDIRAVREALSIPVVANGGIAELGDAKALAVATGAGGVMAAQGLLDNPALFAGYSMTPLECASDFVRLSVQYGSCIKTTQHHVLLMLRAQLSPPERAFLSQQKSVVGLMQSMQQLGVYTENGRHCFSTTPLNEE